MAYVGTVTIDLKTVSGRRCAIVSVAETGASSTDEATISLPWLLGVIVDFEATLTAGDGATIQPKFGTTTGWTTDTQAHMGLQTTRAAHVRDQTRWAFQASASHQIFLRSQAASGSNNAISSRIVILEGAE